MQNLVNHIHEQLSRRVLLPLWSAQRQIRPSRRAVARAFNNGRQMRLSSASWSYEQKSHCILEQLRFAVQRAYLGTEYYKQAFDAAGFDPFADFSFDDFASLPVLERDHVRNAGDRLLSASIPVERLTRDSTGGSTGEPTAVWIGPEEMGWKESAGECFMQRIGAPTGVSRALIWGHHLDPNERETLRERYHGFETNSRWFDCLRLSPQVLEHYHRELERWRPACIIGYASAVGHLAEHILECGYRPGYPTRCIVTGAEKLLPGHREAIAAAFGRPVHERYGGRDVGYVAFQIQPNRDLTFEVDWSNILVEPETCESESSILITKLHGDAMPLIRYRVGDVARFLPGSKPGNPAFRLSEIIGRDVDRIWLPDGRWITGLQIPHMMKDYPVREYMFVQRRDYSVLIQIAPRSGFDEGSRTKILETVGANLPGLSISTVIVDEVPRTKANKWRPVISEVEISGGCAA